MVHDHKLMDISGDISNEPQVYIIIQIGGPPIHRVQWRENEGFSSTAPHKDTQQANRNWWIMTNQFCGGPVHTRDNSLRKPRSHSRVRTARHKIQRWGYTPDVHYVHRNQGGEVHYLAPRNSACTQKILHFRVHTLSVYPPKAWSYTVIHRFPHPAESVLSKC
jgi:hypothetical protein